MHHPIDYARVVKAIGNEMDITLIDTLEDILPQVCLDTLQARCQHALWPTYGARSACMTHVPSG